MHAHFSHIATLIELLQKEISLLLSQNLELTSLELQAIRKALVRHAIFVLLGALLLAGGIALLGAALVGYLNTFMPFWAAALWVGTPLAVLGILLVVFAGRKLGSLPLFPAYSLQAMRTSVRRIRNRIQATVAAAETAFRR